VNSVSIVGDAFAKPMLAALDASPGKWDLSSVRIINSSGVMWSQEVKEGLLRHIPGVILFDSLGSSEAVGMGASVTGGGMSAGTASFSLGAGVRVIGEGDRDVEPGSDEVGVIALPGYLPMGYYKDEEKSARTFRVIDGTRYTIPGDCATVDAAGGIHLLGRGSAVINTGGEKVYPEEVEEVIKRIDGVRDAVCVGLPDERFGEKVCALVERSAGSSSATVESVTAAVHAELAGYKVPRIVFFIDTIGRSPAGKVDYPGLRQRARELAGI
jgi:3-oxocholest-4-en-26-oate---CoA ligase